jgi:hypothetical protein
VVKENARPGHNDVFLTRASEFYENTLKTASSKQAASRGEARCRFVSTCSGAVSIEQVANATPTVRFRSAQEMGTDTLVFFPLSHFQHTMYFGTTIQLYKGKTMQLQYTSSRTQNLQIRRRRFALGIPRTLPRGSSEVLCFKSSRQPVATPSDQSSFSTSSQISSINRR